MTLKQQARQYARDKHIPVGDNAIGQYGPMEAAEMAWIAGWEARDAELNELHLNLKPLQEK